ncbi:MAG: prepilin-type N-terminal cleavage/methylation domain-containing protein [Candidatus Auribacterota bacterium]
MAAVIICLLIFMWNGSQKRICKMTRITIRTIKNHNHILSCKGFSMIELLTVLAIILLVVTLSVGTYQRIRLKSYQMTCLSNLKAISYSMGMYVNDHKGAMVPYINSEGDRWPTILVENQYLHEGTYFEPAGILEGSARDVGQEPLLCYTDQSDNNLFFVDKYAAGGSYAINRDISSGPGVERKWSHIQNAQYKILVSDYNHQGIESSQNFAMSALTNSNNWQDGGTANEGTIGTPHFGNANCLYADWHAGVQKTFSDENFSLEMNYN